MNDEIMSEEKIEENIEQPVATDHLGCEAKLTEAMNGWKRAQADYANLQREVGREREAMGKFAAAEAVGQFLPIYDYFKHALRQQPSESEQSAAVKNWFQGASHIATLFKQTLKQFGVEEIETIGQVFDPKVMEAVKEIETADSPPGTVVEEIEGGYRQGERIIKPAKVIVNQHK